MTHPTGEKRAASTASTPQGNDLHHFDTEQCRARMVKYLDPAVESNRIFFDAFQYACKLHAGQKRKSGAPYISHPCAVVEILMREMGFRDPILLAAALLHDVVEDVPTVRMEDIEARFGPLISELVDGCTKLTRHHMDRAAIRNLTHSKIFLTASRRLGVLVIKLADRLHNLRTLHYLPQAKRMRIAQETVEVYAPIAARFNLFPVKRELYHLALTFLYPRKSKKILQFIRDLNNSGPIQEIQRTLEKKCADAGLSVTVTGRAKGLGSYYDPRKRTLDVANPENYADFLIVLQSDTVLDCYHILGLINTTFSPVPRTIRDFIANPKSNGYQSLHVRVRVSDQNYLIKIRTAEMEQWAVYGILREWDAQQPLSDEHWEEISDLLKSIGEYGGAGHQRRALIRLSDTEEIFVYTPRGDTYFLPKGSNVLDFAYRIHSELGDHCDGAIVSGEWSLPTRQLKEGDIVEVVTRFEALDVDPDLEQLCKTPKARTAINKHLQQKRSHYAEEVGRQILHQEIQRHGLPMEVLESENMHLMLDFFSLKDLSELCVRLGQDLISPHLVLYYLASPPSKSDRPQPKDAPADIVRNVLVVSELDKAVHKFARCCNPYPGQDRVVSTLSERGYSFHQADCRDVLDRHDLEPQALLDIVWKGGAFWPHPLVFRLGVFNESLNTLLKSLAQIPRHISILSIESATDKHDRPMTRLAVALRGFGEAKVFFGSLSTSRVVIEDFGRMEDPRRMNPRHVPFADRSSP